MKHRAPKKSTLKFLKPTRFEEHMFRYVIRAYKRAGLRVPDISFHVVQHHPKWEGWATEGAVYVQRKCCSIELLVHEIAHVIADQVIDNDHANAHNRFWAVIYGIGYQAAVQR